MLTQPTDRNAFLARLSPAEFDLFCPHLNAFSLNAGDRLQDFRAAIEQVVFPHDGVVAMTMPLHNGSTGGVILLGREGLLGGFEAEAAAPAMCDAQVHIPGRAEKMSASTFRSVLDQNPIVRCLASRYVAALMAQAHQTALCNAAHSVEQRIARCLLEVLDRTSSLDVPLTQGTLAHWLGVQRTTVNSAVGKLEETGAISCYRGYIQVVRRDHLERRACECYRNVKTFVSRLFDLPAGAVRSEAVPRPAASQDRARPPAARGRKPSSAQRKARWPVR